MTSLHLAALDKAFVVLLFVRVGSQLETLNQLWLLALVQESSVSESPAESSGTKPLLSLLLLPLLLWALKRFLQLSGEAELTPGTVRGHQNPLALLADPSLHPTPLLSQGPCQASFAA